MAYTTINKSTEHFNTKLYNGTGSSNAITGVGFQPDFTWIKRRNSATAHHLHNAISGATKVLNSNTTNAESTDAQKLSSFDSDGFTVGTNGDANNSSGTFASWNWKANGAGSSNTAGSLNSTVSVNQTAGFSIVKYTAGGSSAVSTIGHGLNAVPKMIIVKGTDANSSPDQWMVYHEALGNTKRIKLNSTDGPATGSGYWNNTTPTSSLFTVGSSSEGNSANGVYIAYCFAEKTGYSKFGSYVGNGNADGVFVYLGFKPSFVMTKCTSASGQSWHMQDNKRDGFNYNNHRLFAESNSAESTTSRMDLLSNGFKYRDGDGQGNGQTFIYMAFAEAPLVGSNNVPCTAR